MAKVTTHTQCKLFQPMQIDGFPTAGCTIFSWIPSEFATVGRHIELKNNGKWEDNWYVKEIYDTLPSKMIYERGRDYLNTRKASDI